MTHDADRTSAVLTRILANHHGPSVTIGTLIDSLADRSFGVIVLLLVLPACIPGPPGLSSIFGLPILFFAGQLAIGQRRPSLPKWLRKKAIPMKVLSTLLDQGRGYIETFERICKPRLPQLTGPTGEKAIGWYLLFLAAVLSLPVPLSNMIPGWGIALIALGLVERDGAAVILGAAVGAAGVAISLTLSAAIVVGIANAFR